MWRNYIIIWEDKVRESKTEIKIHGEKDGTRHGQRRWKEASWGKGSVLGKDMFIKGTNTYKYYKLIL